MTEKLQLLLIITIFSWVSNLIIPLAIYIKKYGILKKRPEEFVGCNAWGIIMDGILANLMNITAMNFYIENRMPINPENIKISLLIGIVITAISHVTMAVREWEIWIMPSPWRWNEAGYWHMVSMTLQMAFFTYALVTIIQNPGLLLEQITIISMIFMSVWILFFLVALYFMSKGLRMGKLYLNYKPW